MEGDAGGEFQDWEVLHSTNSSSDEANSITSSDSVEITMTRVLEEGLDVDVDGGSQGMIQPDYFSPDSGTKYASKEEGSVESDTPSWIDPESETQDLAKESGQFWPDSGSDRSEDHKFSEFDGKQEFGFVGNAGKQAGFEGIGEIGTGGEDLGRFWSDSGGIVPNSMEFDSLEQNIDVGIGSKANSGEGSEILAEESRGDGGDVNSGDKESVAIGAVNKSGEGEKRSVVWWKVPFEFLKFCAFRVSSPVWTLSVAAAVMGFVMLGRRLYKMKRKSQSLQLKVTMDDKVSCSVVFDIVMLLLVFNNRKRTQVTEGAYLLYLQTGGDNKRPSRLKNTMRIEPVF